MPITFKKTIEYGAHFDQKFVQLFCTLWISHRNDVSRRRRYTVCCSI